MNCFNCSPLGSDRLCRQCSVERRNLSLVAVAVSIAALCVLVLMGNGGSPPEIEADQTEVTP